MTNQRVVGIVPLGALGVEPQSSFGNIVGQFRQQGDEEFLDQIHRIDMIIATPDELAVRSSSRDALGDDRLPRRVVNYRILRIGQQFAIRANLVRHVRVGEDGATEHGLQSVGKKLLQYLKELQQVDNLVVSPVTDVGPRVMWFDHLPVDAVAGDTVRVVSIDCRGVDELRDHARQESWKTAGQRLPVLENIAPVACVIKGVSSVVVAQDDGELIPWTTWVTVAATEPQRQILKADPLQVSRAVGLSRLE